MTTSLGVGVIGMGWMGTAHSRSYRLASDRFHDTGVQARLVICADDVEHRATEAQAQLGFAESTTEWRRVIDHPKHDFHEEENMDCQETAERTGRR